LHGNVIGIEYIGPGISVAVKLDNKRVDLLVWISR